MNHPSRLALSAAALMLCSGAWAQDRPAQPTLQTPADRATQDSAARTSTQDPTPRDSSRPSSDPDMSAAAAQRPKEGREALLGGLSAGSIVQSPAGQPIGRVKDIVPDANTGDPAYVVIATRSGSTPVPYAVVAPMYQSGHIVLDKSRLDSAPRVSDSELQDARTAAAWKKQADRYWEPRNPAELR